MVRRYAHLSPNHLTQHAAQIDIIFGENGTNMSQGGYFRGEENKLNRCLRWWPLLDSNQRPSDYESRALTT